MFLIFDMWTLTVSAETFTRRILLSPLILTPFSPLLLVCVPTTRLLFHLTSFALSLSLSPPLFLQDTRMAAMDASTNGAYDTPIEKANFDFKVAVTGRPYSKYFILVMHAYVPFTWVHRCYVLFEAAGAVKCTVSVVMINVFVTSTSPSLPPSLLVFPLPNCPSLPLSLLVYCLTITHSLSPPPLTTHSARIHQQWQQAHRLPRQTFYECIRLTVLESSCTRTSPYHRLHFPGVQRLPIQETGR